MGVMRTGNVAREECFVLTLQLARHVLRTSPSWSKLGVRI